MWVLETTPTFVIKEIAMTLEKLRLMLATMLIRKQLTSSICRIAEVRAGELDGLSENVIAITFLNGKTFDITITERENG
jgi:hypothetical protein